MLATSVSIMEVYYLLLLVVTLQNLFISGEECGPWFIRDSSDPSQCLCSDAMESMITCNQREGASYVKVGHCAYQELNTNETVVAYCPYIFPPHLLNKGFIRLPQNLTDLNDFTCSNIEREKRALFCGTCTNSTGPSVYSFGSQCGTCHAINMFYYILLQYLPITIASLVIILFRCSTVTPPLGHYIMYCNIVQLVLKSCVGQYTMFTANTSELYGIKFLLFLNSLWTLDPLYFLAPPLCISENIHEIYIPVFGIISALYPFAILLLAYVIVAFHARDFKPLVILFKATKHLKPLRSWNNNRSLIQAFATLFFFSFMKLIGAVCDSMFASFVVNIQGEVVATVSYIDPTVVLFSHHHLPVVVLSVTILIFVLLPPTILLLLYPLACFQNVCAHFSARWQLRLKIFTDTFHGSYKDGTNATRDYRPTAGIIFTIWITFPIVNGMVALWGNIVVPWLVIFIPLLILQALACVVFEPYKEKSANISGTVLLTLLAVAASISIILDLYSFSTTLAWLLVGLLTLPHCTLYGLGIYHLAKKFKECVDKAVRGSKTSLIN